MALKGFEIQTGELNEYELNVLVPVLVRCLRNKVGKLQAVKSGYIISKMQESGYNINDARLRKVIHHIRMNAYVPCLMATSAGYYVSNDKKEMADYVDSLRGRRQAIDNIIGAMTLQAGLS